MSNIVSVSWERGPDASRLYCKTGNVSVRPPPHLSFSTGMDFSSVEGRPLWRFSDVLTSARCTQISRWVNRRLDFINEELRSKVMLLRRPGMLTLQCRNMRRSPGTTSTPWGPSPSSPTFIPRATAKKTAKSPLSSWGWPRPA